MSPAWALAGRGGTAQPLRLPAGGLMFNVQGDKGLSSAAGVVTGWADQSGLGQDLDDVGVLVSTGVHFIDGIPTISFPTVWGNNGIYIARTANMLRSDGVTPLADGPRTLMMMVLPFFGGGPGISVTGGPLFSFFNQSADYQCLFELGPQPPIVGPGWSIDGAYCWAGPWTPLIGGPNTPTNEFGPIPSTSGGQYDNVPTLVEWRSTAGADLEFLVNNVPQTITPAGRTSVATSVFTGFMLGNTQAAVGTNFFGAIAQAAAWDYNQATDPAAHAQAINYFVSRYPSAPITPDP